MQRSIRFPADVAAAVGVIATRQDRSFSATVLLLVRRALESHGPISQAEVEEALVAEVQRSELGTVLARRFDGEG